MYSALLPPTPMLPPQFRKSNSFVKLRTESGQNFQISPLCCFLSHTHKHSNYSKLLQDTVKKIAIIKRLKPQKHLFFISTYYLIVSNNITSFVTLTIASSEFL